MKEEQIGEILLNYLMNYITKLIQKKEELFIAITNIDQELLQYVDTSVFANCKVAIVERDNYAEAVRLRNDRNVSRIVLVTSDSIRQIDSLKDFVEYPIIPDNREVLWEVIQETFDLQQVSGPVKEFLNTLLLNIQVSIKEFLQYLNASIKGNKLIKEKITGNLYFFRLWGTKSGSLKISMLKKILRYSDPSLIEKRLGTTTALEKLKLSKEEIKKITSCLSRNEIPSLFHSVDFEKVELCFRGTHRRREEKKDKISEEHRYQYSYEMLLEEEGRDIRELEEEIGDEEEEKKEKEIPLAFQETYECFKISAEEQKNFNKSKEEIRALCEMSQSFLISEEKRSAWVNLLEDFERKFEDIMSGLMGNKITPMLLHSYCEKQFSFVASYFRILTFILKDEIMMKICSGNDLIEKIQFLFCEENGGCITMPYYHPVAGFYFLFLKNIYEEAVSINEEDSLELCKDLLIELTEREKIHFPIRFIQYQGDLYQLDYSSLMNLRKIKFYNRKNSVSNSRVNFRFLNTAIENYILKNPYLCEMTISIIDLDDFGGVRLLFKKLQELIYDDTHLISKIIINIVSKKEEILKEQLLKLYDTGMDDPGIYFKFTCNRYMKENSFDLEQVMRQSDILFFADSNAIYNPEKLVRFMKNANKRLQGLQNFQLEEQLKLYREGKEQVELLWDTLHQIQRMGEAELVLWNNQEINIQKLMQITDRVNREPAFTAVIITTNKSFLRYLYLKDNYEVRKNKIDGKESMILTFSKGSKRFQISDSDSEYVEILFSPLLKEFFGEQEFRNLLLDGDIEKDIHLRLIMKEGKFQFQCIIEKEEEATGSEESDRNSYYKKMSDELLSFAFSKKGYLAESFRDVLINEFYEKVENYRMALAVYYLGRQGGEIEVECSERNEKSMNRVCDRDCTEIINFQDMMLFFEELNTVDDSAVTQFSNNFQKNMLEQVIKAGEYDHLIFDNSFKNMKELYERIK